jgi:hypothetical protein
MTAKRHDAAAKLLKRMNDPMEQTGDWLKQVVRGYFNYHALPGNLERLYTFRPEIARRWLFTLRRRSQRSRWTGERFQPLIDLFLPAPAVLHPYPLTRFYAKHPDKSRGR